MSASSSIVTGSPGNTRRSAKPTELACSPFASGVPTVRWSEAGCGGAHDSYASGSPCMRFGCVHAR